MTPTAFIPALASALRLSDLRSRLLFTLGILVLFRFVAHVPVVRVDTEVFRRLFQQSQLLGMLNLFSGGAMENLSIAAMGVYPYITATIVMQILTAMVPALQALSKEGEAGRTRINLYTHWIMVPLAAVQGFAQLQLVQSLGLISGVGVTGGSLWPTLVMVLSMTAGTVLLVWLGELITEYGIGNGVSLIIFSGIVAGLPAFVGQSLVGGTNLVALVPFVAIGAGIVYAIVIFNEAQRRVPVQYSRSTMRGGRVFRQGGTTHIPLKVNMAGMIPLLFALTLMMLPQTLLSPFAASNVGWVRTLANGVTQTLGQSSPVYWALYFLLVVGFTFFYTLIIFQQQNLAESLQTNGGFVPGIRPGRATADYLNGILNRITWAGALFLGGVAVTPYLAELFTGVRSLQLSSTGLLIVVGVVLDTMKQLEAQLLMRRYQGFLS